jgi:hypothetical protein
MTQDEESRYIVELEGVAKTPGQSTPTDRLVVISNLMLYRSITRLDSSSTKLFVVSIALAAAMLLVAVVQAFGIHFSH